MQRKSSRTNKRKKQESAVSNKIPPLDVLQSKYLKKIDGKVIANESKEVTSRLSRLKRIQTETKKSIESPKKILEQSIATKPINKKENKQEIVEVAKILESKTQKTVIDLENKQKNVQDVKSNQQIQVDEQIENKKQSLETTEESESDSSTSSEEDDTDSEESLPLEIKLQTEKLFLCSICQKTTAGRPFWHSQKQDKRLFCLVCSKKLIQDFIASSLLRLLKAENIPDFYPPLPFFEDQLIFQSGLVTFLFQENKLECPTCHVSLPVWNPEVVLQHKNCLVQLSQYTCPLSEECTSRFSECLVGSPNWIFVLQEHLKVCQAKETCTDCQSQFRLSELQHHKNIHELFEKQSKEIIIKSLFSLVNQLEASQSKDMWERFKNILTDKS
jgi:hypothetical protein